MDENIRRAHQIASQITEEGKKAFEGGPLCQQFMDLGAEGVVVTEMGGEDEACGLFRPDADTNALRALGHDGGVNKGPQLDVLSPVDGLLGALLGLLGLGGQVERKIHPPLLQVHLLDATLDHLPNVERLFQIQNGVTGIRRKEQK